MVQDQERIRLIFKDVYKVYALYKDSSLFKIMTGLERADVTEILADTYSFYKKYADTKSPLDWNQISADARMLNHKFNNCRLCREILVELLKVLEKKDTR